MNVRITLRRVQRAIDFVEAHLFEPFSLDDVAMAAGMSRYHLHRLLSATYGESLKGYVRKRRLTEAAELLRSSERRIIEIALDAGFGSQAAFTRAFQAQFGATPGRYRREPNVRARPGLLRPEPGTLEHRHTGVTREPRIVHRDTLLAVRGIAAGVDFENDEPIITLWQKALSALSAFDTERVDPATPLYGVTQSHHPDIELQGDACIAYIAGTSFPPWIELPGERLIDVTVPPGWYAVFEHDGPPEHIKNTVNYAWASWLPRCPHEKASRPDLEIVTRGDADAALPHMELWVSITPATSLRTERGCDEQQSDA